MKLKISLIFLCLATVITYVALNYDKFSEVVLNNKDVTNSIVTNKELSKVELNDFFKSQKWVNYENKFNDIALNTVEKTIYLHLWASWCGPCINEIPELIAFAKKNLTTSQIFLISLDDSQEDLDKFLKSFPEMNQSHFIRIWDFEKKISKKLNVDRLPMTVILQPNEMETKTIRAVVDWQRM